MSEEPTNAALQFLEWFKNQQMVERTATSPIDQIRIRMLALTKDFGLRPKCLFGLIPTMNIYHFIYGIFLRELSKFCQIRILFHDHLLARYLEAPGFSGFGYENPEQCMNGFRNFLLNIGVNDENCEYYEMSRLLPRMIVDKNFIDWLGEIDIQRLGEKLKEATFSQVLPPHDMNDALVCATECYASACWDKMPGVSSHGTNDFVLLGEDKKPVYDVMEKYLPAKKSSPTMIYLRLLLKGARSVVIGPGMSADAIEDTIKRCARLGQTDEKMYSEEIAEKLVDDLIKVCKFIRLGCQVELSNPTMTAFKDIDGLLFANKFRLATSFAEELMKQSLFQSTRQPPAGKLARKVRFASESIAPRDLDSFIDFIKNVPCRYLLKLVYLNPGRIQSEYWQMLSRDYIRIIRKKSVKVKSVSPGSVSGYFARAIGLKLIYKEGNRYYPNYESVELRLGADLLKDY